MTSTRSLSICLLIFMIQMCAIAVPPDHIAAEYWVQIGSFLAESPSSHDLPPDFMKEISATTNSANFQIKCAVAYASAFIKDDSASNVLEKLKNDSSKQVREVAQMAHFLRKTLSMSAEDRFGALCYELGKSRDKYSNIFLINYLGREYGNKITDLFLLALDECQQKHIRHELLYQLVYNGRANIRPKILAILEKEPQYQLDEYDAFALGCITPGRSKSWKQNNTADLLQTLKNIMQESEEK